MSFARRASFRRARRSETANRCPRPGRLRSENRCAPDANPIDGSEELIASIGRFLSDAQQSSSSDRRPNRTGQTVGVAERPADVETKRGPVVRATDVIPTRNGDTRSDGRGDSLAAGQTEQASDLSPRVKVQAVLIVLLQEAHSCTAGRHDRGKDPHVDRDSGRIEARMVVSRDRAAGARDEPLSFSPVPERRIRDR